MSVRDSASFIWDLVSGLPPHKRGLRRLVALQAYIDDSGGTELNQHPYFVLGGFVSTAERWAEFSADWQAVLDLEPRLEYFKMSEAGSLNGQFHARRGWDKPKRDARLAKFVEVARSYPIFRTSVAVDKTLFNEHIVGLNVPNPRPTANDPYYLAFHNLVTSLPLLQAFNNKSIPEQGKIDFIFDYQSKTGTRAVDAWDHIKCNILPNLKIKGVPDIMPFLGSQPIFRDEKEFLPLQAADLYVWHVRRHLRNNRVIAVRPTQILSRLYEIPGNDKVFDRPQMLELKAEISDLISRLRGHRQ